MLANDPVRHEQAEAGAGFLGREVRFEEVMTILVCDPGTVVGDAEIRPSVVAAASRHLHVTTRRRRGNRVVDEVGQDLAEQERVSFVFDIIGLFSKTHHYFLRARSWPGHSKSPRSKLVEVNGF